MGAGIALQSAAADPRIEAVVAEASFADLAKGLTITPVCENSPGSARLSSLPAPGRWYIVPKNSPVFRPRKSHGKSRRLSPFSRPPDLR